MDLKGHGMKPAVKKTHSITKPKTSLFGGDSDPGPKYSKKQPTAIERTGNHASGVTAFGASNDGSGIKRSSKAGSR